MPIDERTLARHLNGVYIETGTFRGGSLQAALKAGFDRCISMEIAPELHQRARKMFADIHGVTLLLGSSAILLPEVLAGIPPEQPITFFLDAHGYAGDGNKGASPLLTELDSIARYRDGRDTVLIDDYAVMDRAFRAGVTEMAVRERLLRINPAYLLVRMDNPHKPWDILGALP